MTDTFQKFETPEAARDEARRLGRETGDIHCAMNWKGNWIVYELGYGPVSNSEDEDEE